MDDLGSLAVLDVHPVHRLGRPVDVVGAAARVSHQAGRVGLARHPGDALRDRRARQVEPVEARADASLEIVEGRRRETRVAGTHDLGPGLAIEIERSVGLRDREVVGQIDPVEATVSAESPLATRSTGVFASLRGTTTTNRPSSRTMDTSARAPMAARRCASARDVRALTSRGLARRRGMASKARSTRPLNDPPGPRPPSIVEAMLELTACGMPGGVFP